MGRTKNKEGQKRPLEKLVQQVQRFQAARTSSPIERPPDAAGAALGKALCHAFLQTADKKAQELVLSALCQHGLNPSISHTFFEGLQEAIVESSNPQKLLLEAEDERTDEWLSQLILQLEQVVREHGDDDDNGVQQQRESLTACIRTYATFLAYCPSPLNDGANVIRTYHRLQLMSSRSTFIKELIPTAIRETSKHSVEQIRSVLSPVLAVAVLSTKCSPFEQSLFMGHLWRGVRTLVWDAMNLEECFKLLDWLTQALDLFLAGPKQSSGEETLSTELAESWLLELMQLALSMGEDGVYSEGGEWLRWVDHILGHTLPNLFSTERHLSWKPLLTSLLDLTSSFDASRLAARSPLEPTTAFGLCGLLLRTSVTNDRRLLLQLLATDLMAQKISISCQTVACLLHSVGAIFIQDANVRQSAIWLQESLEANTKRNAMDATRNFSPSKATLDSILMDAHRSTFVSTVLQRSEFSTSELSVHQQLTAMLFAMSQFTSDEKPLTDCYTFLKRLLNQHPHLEITILPVVLYHIHEASLQKNGNALVQHLDFLCEALVQDPHAAKEVWTLVGHRWLNPHSPHSVRTIMIRLLPRTCKSNSRLYRRTIEELGVCIVDKQPEIRLAVAATIADLAREDCIRDVSDVIAWIQQLLMEGREQPIHSLIVHYAVLCLHFLVVSGELDFDLVVKVLNKRLCPVSDATKLLELPLVVLESLALLLGDGEVSEGGSSEDDEGGDQDVGVSPQVAASVSALIAIGVKLQKPSSESQDELVNSSLRNLQRNIFKSLCNYSNDALGLHGEEIQATIAGSGSDVEAKNQSTASRYQDVIELGALGLKCTCFDATATDPSDEPIVVFARRIVSMEEEVFGTTAFWQKGGHSRERFLGMKAAKKKSLAALSALPPASELCSLSPKSAPHALAIATLLSIDRFHLTTLRDNADSAIETSDPLLLVFAIKAFIHATTFFQSLNEERVESVISEVRGWYEVYVSPDALFLILSSFGVTAAEADDESFTTGRENILDNIHDEVMGAFKSGLFQKEEISKLCLGLVGYSSLLNGDTTRVFEVIDLLEKSVRGYGGQQGFGAYFALSFLSQGALRAQQKKRTEGTDEVKQAITRISSFIIEELLSCFEDVGDIGTTFVACTRTGKSTGDLVRALTGLGPNSLSVLMTKQVAARYLLISCSLCLPTLVTVDGELLLSAFRLLESFEWVSGKGIAIAAVLEKIANSALLSSAEIVGIHAKYDELFEGRIDGNEESLYADGLDDIFYACNSMSKKAASVVARRLLVGNTDLFDDDGRALSLIACVSSISTVPPLGVTLFTEEAMLYADSTKEDVAGVVEIVSKAAARNDGSKYCGMGVVLLGLLSSVQMQSETNAASQLSSTSLKEDKIVGGQKTGMINFKTIPRPPPGTLSAATISILESCYSSSKPCCGKGTVAGAMGIMEALSLPKEYAKHLLEKILRQEVPNKFASLRLLCSQLLRGQRSVVRDEGSFLGLAVSFATTSQGWNNLSSDPSQKSYLVQKFVEILPAFPVESISEVLSSIWAACLKSQRGDWELAQQFLSVFKGLLINTRLSPRSLICARDFALSRLFADIVAVHLEQGMRESNQSMSLIESYACCLAEIPVTVLDERDFFAVGKESEDSSEELLRALLSLMLSRVGYFPSRRRSLIVNSITFWLNKNLVAADGTRERDSLRRLFCCFAKVTSTEESSTKADILEKLFEILLLSTNETCAVGLELLSVVLAYWSQALGPRVQDSLSYLFTLNVDLVETLPIQQLDDFIHVTTDELPSNLRNVIAQERSASTHFYRLYTCWLECGSGQRPIEILEKSLSSCRDSMTDQDILESLMG